MAEFEQRDNSGALFRAKGEKRSERSPGYSGKAMIGGVVYRISAWKKETRGGETFLSLSFRPADEEHGRRDDRAHRDADAF
ncbi:MAG: hypothetical protein E6I48_07795 [Chloroflexi bacterium]|nr:MAG: hypothetical protein E6I48_07795 [Chloroflexota bacterium]